MKKFNKLINELYESINLTEGSVSYIIADIAEELEEKLKTVDFETIDFNNKEVIITCKDKTQLKKLQKKIEGIYDNKLNATIEWELRDNVIIASITDLSKADQIYNW